MQGEDVIKHLTGLIMVIIGGRRSNCSTTYLFFLRKVVHGNHFDFSVFFSYHVNR